MKYHFNNDHDLLEALNSRMPDREAAAMRHLCQDPKLVGTVRQQVMLMGGQETDANSALNYALFIFFQKVKKGEYDTQRAGITTYLVGVAKWVYHTQQRSQKRAAQTEQRYVESQEAAWAEDPEWLLNQQSRRERYNQILSWTGERCRQLLHLRFQSFSMEEIAQELSYKSADSAKMAVHDCRKKLNEMLAKRPDWLKEFNNL